MLSMSSGQYTHTAMHASVDRLLCLNACCLFTLQGGVCPMYSPMPLNAFGFYPASRTLFIQCVPAEACPASPLPAQRLSWSPLFNNLNTSATMNVSRCVIACVLQLICCCGLYGPLADLLVKHNQPRLRIQRHCICMRSRFAIVACSFTMF